ncbi:MAG: zinc ribbon domain-containing protein [Mariprofundaceae bacterium]|nr:zinc ribbon domain-containing protein [Mariprofundaceae bacterium]
MMKVYKSCQSCGMPKKMDDENGGSEKDGSKSDKYCSYCYKDGDFFMKSEIDTPQKMQKMCIKMMKKQGMNGMLAWLMTRGIPRLERWKK